MRSEDLREFTTDELLEKEKELKKELYNLNYQRKLHAVDKPGLFGNLKKDIAKILTIIRERELQDERSNGKS